MQFFTQIKIPPFRQKINHSEQIFSIGSCFAENIAERLRGAKFNITSSPTGILFNPESIANCIDMLACRHTMTVQELRCSEELWFSYDCHSSFSSLDKEDALSKMQQAINQGSAALQDADVVIVTFGTAWVYRLNENNKIVANCHKQPQALFNRELLTVEHIVNRWSKLLDSTLSGKHVIFTVSPIRHLSDGLEQNSLSKAVLRIAIAELTAKYDNVTYFPSFEIMNDELRDYRFYAEDMTHPSQQAIEYIWQQFSDAAITEQSLQLIERLSKIAQATKHRPLNPQSEAYRNFCLRQLEEIEKINHNHPTIDLSKEKATFVAHL